MDRCIEIAKGCGRPLKIAAKVDDADVEYFNDTIKPLLGTEGVEFLGEVGEGRKEDLMRGAAALLMPIDWPEPFGLVLIEAMACGTPVIAWDLGSIPEIVEDGVTGFVVGSIEEAVAAAKRVHEINREECRREFERRFSAQRMAEDYLAVYENLIGTGHVRMKQGA